MGVEQGACEARWSQEGGTAPACREPEQDAEATGPQLGTHGPPPFTAQYFAAVTHPRCGSACYRRVSSSATHPMS